MSYELEIRESVQADASVIESLYPQAFPDEDLLPLVRDLLQHSAIAVSLVGTIDSRIAGHAHCDNGVSCNPLVWVAVLGFSPPWKD